MKKFAILTLVFTMLLSATALAATSIIKKCQSIRKEMPQFKVDRILPGPVSGMCEIWANNNVIYYFPDKKLLFFGEIWDTKGHSLTQDSRNRILAAKIKSLDLRKAIRWGKGPVRVIFITDPDCPYCGRTEKFLLSPLFKDKITAYVFLYPLTGIHPHARKHSLIVLSSRKPVETLLAFAQKKNLPAISISKAAERRLSEMKKEMQKLSVTAVPVVIVGKKVIRGANLEQILSAINQSLTQAKK